MRSSLSMFAPPGSRSSSASASDMKRFGAASGDVDTVKVNDDGDDDDDAGVIGLDAEHETCVVRYFQTRLLLRYVGLSESDDASATETKRGAFLSIYDPNGSSSSSSPCSLLGKAPALVVLPPVELKNQASSSARVATGVFTIIPAEGFEKEPGQPVCYSDPVELVDQFGRILGIASRSPHAGHLAVDNHGGALVVVFERRETESGVCPSQVLKHHAGISTVTRDNPKYQLHKKLGLRRTSTGAPVAEICGGDRVYIPGLVCVQKKQFPSGCVMQHQFFSEASSPPTNASGAALLPAFLECIVVVTSGNTELPIDVNPLLGGNESVLAKSKLHMADRTATGEFVGVLHHGILHRRTDHTKIWKKRFFVLTQVALHRFEAHVTFESSRGLKSRGDVLIKDCRRVRYEKFARPHELDIEFHNGKTLSMHSDDAVSCAKWASVLSYAIESPQWIHAERSFTTFWRSSERYESPKCPRVESVEVVASSQQRYYSPRETVIAEPQWSEKLALGELDASDHVVVHLSNGSSFSLSLDDVSRALLSPSSSTLHTVVEVDAMSDRESSVGDVPAHLNAHVTRSSTFTSAHPPPLFQVRLRYRTELQLDRRIDIKMELALLKLRLKFFGALIFGGFAPLYVALRRYRGMPLVSLEWASAWRLQSLCGYQMHILAVCLETLVLAAVAPLLWHTFAMWYQQRVKGAKLQWFLTLLSLEVQPEASETSQSSNNDARRSTCALPSPGWSPDASCDLAQQDDVYRFRLENALETILGRPHFPFFAIKKFFPNQFSARDSAGRRVLHVALHAVDMTSLSNHNVSPFAVERYFLYVWEFIWSYCDFVHGVAHSELVLVLDCSDWQYTSTFGRSVRVMRNVLLKTHRYYPGRLAKVEIRGTSALFQCYAQLFCALLPLDLRTKCTIEIAPKPQDSDAATRGRALDAPSADEQAFSEFALSLLSTYATVSISSFTKRELDQATRFTKFGSLQSAVVDDARASLSSSRTNTSSTSSSNSSSTTGPRARVGTRALLIPAAENEWQTVYQHDGFMVCMSKSRGGASASVPSTLMTQIAQVRGSMKMRSTDIAAMVLYLHDPSQWRFWNPSSEQMVLLDTLSSREDVGFWSRQVPFLGFSNDGNCIEDVQTTHSYFNCLVRRIYEERKAARGESSFTVLWKTTSSQQSIIHDPASSGGSKRESTRTRASTVAQWKRFEDPTVTVCLVLEPRYSLQHASGREKRVLDGVDLSFWYQVLLPAARDARKGIEVRLRVSLVRPVIDERSLITTCCLTSSADRKGTRS